MKRRCNAHLPRLHFEANDGHFRADTSLRTVPFHSASECILYSGGYNPHMYPCFRIPSDETYISGAKFQRLLHDFD